MVVACIARRNPLSLAETLLRVAGCSFGGLVAEPTVPGRELERRFEGAKDLSVAGDVGGERRHARAHYGHVDFDNAIRA